ncbi:MAG: hypothetical protein LBH02_00815 [Methanocalculaceae archaeon]|nr:hypothetical protein [Methanocalculaceae archaeon]
MIATTQIPENVQWKNRKQVCIAYDPYPKKEGACNGRVLDPTVAKSIRKIRVRHIDSRGLTYHGTILASVLFFISIRFGAEEDEREKNYFRAT